jgi:mannose PTS system EIIA component
MNSILLIAHAPLASALKSAALHAFPDADACIAVIDVLPSQQPEQTLATARSMLARAQLSGDISGTLVMSDVLGATPCNVAKQLVDGVNIRCIAGASLPMLLRAITYAHESLAVMADKALVGANQGAIAVT